MQVSELRIGNIVHGLTGFCTVRGLGVDGIWVNDKGGPVPADLFEPVDINEQWLEQCGAYRNEGGAWWNITLPDQKERGGTSILRYSQGIAIIEQVIHQGFTQSKAAEVITDWEKKNGKIEDDDKWSMVMRRNSVIVERRIRYMHELQNLYHSLSNEELKVEML